MPIYTLLKLFSDTERNVMPSKYAEERNNMEKLTLAALSHLPTSILFVHDLTGECGSSAHKQV
jgi:nucleolar GTP-binding protein